MLMSKNVLNLNKIKVHQYIELQANNEYDIILSHSNQKKSFANKETDILNLPYVDVKYCIDIMRGSITWEKIAEVFKIVFGCTRDKFFNAEITDYFPARNYIDNTFKLIIENESVLAKKSNVNITKWQMAGGDRLNQFNNVISLDQLAERYGVYPFDLGRKPYSEIFYLISMVKTINEVNFNYSKPDK